ncbi:MAG: hydrogenase maturation protease [Coriobacteriia bacterium]|nr:hydrogenase maturation protease [Coriobacteriia bacterium]MCL2870419.1 hydrogenase maturation protease [Coriobacteriia bacterium]
MPSLSAQPVNTLDDLRDRLAREKPTTDELVLIMGAGNIIMGDEGVGPTALDYLHKHYDFPENVALLDVATTGISMLPNLEGMDHLIIIDAADDSGHPPGTVIFYTPEDLADQQVMHSAHDQRLTDVLFAAKLTGIELKSVVVVGVQVESLEHFVLELSEPVKEAIPVACAATLHCLQELGYAATARSDVEVNPVLLDALQNYGPETSSKED